MKKQYRILKAKDVKNDFGDWGSVSEQDVFVTDNLRETIDRYVDKDTKYIAVRVQRDYVEEE